MRPYYYTLNDAGEPVPERDHRVWSRWYEAHIRDCIIAQDRVGEALVSTVFLSLDHGFISSGPPVLWETLVFDAPDGDERMRRYASEADARAGHDAVLRELQALHPAA